MRKKIPVSEPNLTALERTHLIKAFDSGWISSKGEYIEMFEKKFSNYVGSRYAITTANGTVSLHLILKALGIKKGDEVIVPNFTYVATANAITYVGATPVFVDSDPYHWNIIPEEIELAITPRTKAIMVVHVYGGCAEMEKILNIANKYNLYIIEDSAEAIGTCYKDRHVGTYGIAGSFSFYGNKTITTGEGGMIVTNDESINFMIRKLKNQGTTEEYWHDVIGYNYRMTNLQAAIGYAQMLRIDKLVAKKKQIANWYRKYLNHPAVVHHPNIENCENSYWMYSILLHQKISFLRENIREILLKKYGIETRPFFYPMTKLPMYRKYGMNRKYPNVESFYKRGINLPSSTTLEEEDVVYISGALRETLNELLKAEGIRI